MNESVFIKPDSPFLLITEDIDGTVSYWQWNDEKSMQDDAVERRGNGERIILAVEISSYRNIEIPPEYMVDDFIEEINNVYEDAKEQGFDSIVLAIDTDIGDTCYISDTSDGFQCDAFDFCFEDIDSIAEALFNEKLIGKPKEIRIE